jgi:hypothetical protein
MFWKKPNSTGLELLEKHEQMLADACLTHAHQMQVISQRLASNWETKILREAETIISVARGREALRQVILDVKKGKDRGSEARREFRYQISSLFLRDCWEYLKSDPGQNERLHLVTGTITTEGTRVLSRIEKVRYEKQGSAYVSADKIDTQQRILSLAEDYGHLLLAVFHSHMTRGMLATTPSSIDQAFLERMAQIGCHCLGGIFSLDGYTRFFMREGHFEIEVYGKGIIKVEENSAYKIFKIVEENRRASKSV